MFGNGAIVWEALGYKRQNQQVSSHYLDRIFCLVIYCTKAQKLTFLLDHD